MALFIMILLVSSKMILVKGLPINPQLLKSMVGAKTTETVPYFKDRILTTPKVFTFDITLLQVSQDEEKNATIAEGYVPENSSKVKESFKEDVKVEDEESSSKVEDSFNRQEDVKVKDTIQKGGQSELGSAKTGIEDGENDSLQDESDNLEETGSTEEGGKGEMLKSKIC